jgi:hypothetical protein
VQLAASAGLHVIATAGARDIEYLRALGAEKILETLPLRIALGQLLASIGERCLNSLLGVGSVCRTGQIRELLDALSR